MIALIIISGVIVVLVILITFNYGEGRLAVGMTFFIPWIGYVALLYIYSEENNMDSIVYRSLVYAPLVLSILIMFVIFRDDL